MIASLGSFSRKLIGDNVTLTMPYSGENIVFSKKRNIVVIEGSSGIGKSVLALDIASQAIKESNCRVSNIKFERPKNRKEIGSQWNDLADEHGTELGSSAAIETLNFESEIPFDDISEDLEDSLSLRFPEQYGKYVLSLCSASDFDTSEQQLFIFDEAHLVSESESKLKELVEMGVPVIIVCQLFNDLPRWMKELISSRKSEHILAHADYLKGGIPRELISKLVSLQYKGDKRSFLMVNRRMKNPRLISTELPKVDLESLKTLRAI